MNREDLKVGYLVELRNGKVGMVIPLRDGTLNISNSHVGLVSVGQLKNDMTTVLTNHGFDVVKVFGFSYKYNVNLDVEERDLLWERKDYPKLTRE